MTNLITKLELVATDVLLFFCSQIDSLSATPGECGTQTNKSILCPCTFV